MPVNYVLIDYENLQPETVAPLMRADLRVIVFVGANQARLPYEFVASLQKIGSRGEYIKIAGNGVNALDFHIAYYVGKFAAADPVAQFHIVSKDAGFDPLIQHLSSKKIRVSRINSVAELASSAAKKVPDRVDHLDLVVTRLRSFKAARPRSVKTLSSTIAAILKGSVSDKETASIIQSLTDRGHVTIEGAKVAYGFQDG